MDRARATLAERYYAGPDVLFADARTDWEDHVTQVERITSLADGIGSSPPGKAARKLRAQTQALPAVEAGVEERLTWLTGQARVRALDALGEHLKAVAVMEAWLLRDRQQAPSSPDGSPR